MDAAAADKSEAGPPAAGARPWWVIDVARRAYDELDDAGVWLRPASLHAYAWRFEGEVVPSLPHATGLVDGIAADLIDRSQGAGISIGDVAERFDERAAAFRDAADIRRLDDHFAGYLARLTAADVIAPPTRPPPPQPRSPTAAQIERARRRAARERAATASKPWSLGKQVLAALAIAAVIALVGSTEIGGQLAIETIFAAIGEILDGRH